MAIVKGYKHSLALNISRTKNKWIILTVSIERHRFSEDRPLCCKKNCKKWTLTQSSSHPRNTINDIIRIFHQKHFEELLNFPIINQNPINIIDKHVF